VNVRRRAGITDEPQYPGQAEVARSYGTRAAFSARNNNRAPWFSGAGGSGCESSFYASGGDTLSPRPV
jgi:hypothetical protein